MRHLTRSLGTRLLAATLATAAITLTAVVGLVVASAGSNLREQASEVSRWSEQQLSEGLLGDARLAAARVEILRQDVERRFASLAARADVGKAVFSGNTVAVSELLRGNLPLVDIDGVIAFDLKLRAIGADRVDADLLAANEAIVGAGIAGDVKDILARNDPSDRRTFRRTLPLEDSLARALSANEAGDVVDVFGQPLFDDFGDVIGVLVGYRVMRGTEPTLAAFAHLSGRDVLVFTSRRLVAGSGGLSGAALPQPRSRSALGLLAGGTKVARCLPTEPALTVCVAAPAAELERLSANLTSMGERHSSSLVNSLGLASAIALALFALVSVLLSRWITGPLARVTDIVVQVAKGHWRLEVPYVDRTDEVGDIARAVVILERSLEERDQLRQDVVLQNGILREREEQLREQNRRFDAALNNMSQGLCMFDAGRRLEVFNHRFLEVYGLSSHDVTFGMREADLRGLLEAASRSNARTSPGATRRSGTTETLKLPDGRSIELSIQQMSHGGWVETHEDVTERRTIQARIAHMAHHDALTGLANRVLFADRLTAALDRGGRTAVLCLDLDDFKVVNDTMGHAAGDDLLRKVADRLTEVVVPPSLLARLGGDEFAIVHVAEGQPESGGRLANQILETLGRPFLVQGQVLIANASVGIAFAQGDDREDPERLLRQADLALYAAKREGRGRLRMFESAMEDRLHQRHWLQRDLQAAIQSGGIDVHFQPLFSMASNEISGFEALARWLHPQRGLISPADFIPLAEETGLIESLGEYVLTRACAEAVKWPSDIKVAVNVSPVQVRGSDLQGMVSRALSRTGLPNRRLELEITESVVLQQDADTLAKLHRLRGLGIRFSMDDFGTGYSSLSSLNSFPFDKIKLDKSFVRDAARRDESAAIVKVVADLGRSLGLTTTAEGVETAQQLASLRASGFSEAQGFLFSPAVPADEVPQLIARFKRLAAAA